jgi:Aspartate/tyrosine/aromatic aminotransferase
VHGYLREHHIPHTVPRGAFYQILPLPDGHDSMTEALALLRDGVAVVPGTAFGEPDGPFLRLCLTAPSPTLIAGLDLVRQRLW